MSRHWILIAASLLVSVPNIAQAAANFTIAASPFSQTVLLGNSTTYSVTVTGSGGFKGAVALSVTGLPAGATGTFNPTSVSGSGTSTLTVSASSTASIGSATITITGTSGSLVRTAAVIVVVSPPTDFTLSVTSNAQSLTQGSSTSFTLTVGPVNGFTGSVNFTTAGLPGGATAGYSPVSVTGQGSSTLTISTTSATPPGAYPNITITGISGVLSHSVTVTLYVNGLGADFSLSITPTTEVAYWNQFFGEGSGGYTIQMTSTNGFNDLVTFSASAFPSGSYVSFNPTSLVGAGSTTLSLEIFTTGTFPFTVSATSLGGITRTATASLTVVPCTQQFTDGSSPTSQTIFQGGIATYSIGINAQCGYSGTNVFSVGGLPSGATASFQPTSVTGSGSTVMTVTTSSSTPTGSYQPYISFSDVQWGLGVGLVVNAATTKFSLSSTPASQSTSQGQAANYTVTVTYASHFSGTVALSAAGLPPGATATFTPPSVTQTGTSTLAITTTGSTPLGTYPLAITGTSGTLGNVTRASLTVNQAFSLASSPSTQTVSQGLTANYTATVTYNAGFSGTVTFGVSGLPAGATAAFTPASLTATGTATLAVTTSNSMSTTGSFPLTITATSGTVTSSTTVTLTITTGFGTISGTVSQVDGVTAIPGATITYFQGGASLGSVTSSAMGSYTISNLAVGNYALYCSAASYKTYIQSPVAADANTVVTQNFPLPFATVQSTSKEYIRLNSRIVAVEFGNMGPQTIDFEQFTGSDLAPSAAVPPVTVDGTTFAGGHIFPITGGLYADSTVVYGSGGPAGTDWCPGCLQTMTITFSQPVNGLSLELINGAASNDTFTVQDDRGGQQTVNLPNDSSTSYAILTFTASGINQVTITSSLSGWDFWLDNINFTPTSGTMAPTGLSSPSIVATFPPASSTQAPVGSGTSARSGR